MKYKYELELDINIIYLDVYCDKLNEYGFNIIKIKKKIQNL